MDEKDIKAAVLSYLHESAMQNVRDYAERGRTLEHEETDDLAGRWVILVREWAADPYEPQDGARSDIEAELILRGTEVPYHLVKEEMNTLGDTAAAGRLDPDAAEQLVNDIAEHAAREQGKPN